MRVSEIREKRIRINLGLHRPPSVTSIKRKLGKKLSFFHKQFRFVFFAVFIYLKSKSDQKELLAF